MIQFYKTEQEILRLTDAFRTRTLPAEQWTHQAHLVASLWFNRTYSGFEAICYLRSGIIAYNISTGGENTPEKGYHETLTIFWCKVIRRFVLKNTELSLAGLCNAFLNSELASKELPLQYYSREVLFSTKARAMWVSPNLGILAEDDLF